MHYTSKNGSTIHTHSSRLDKVAIVRSKLKCTEKRRRSRVDRQTPKHLFLRYLIALPPAHGRPHSRSWTPAIQRCAKPIISTLSIFTLWLKRKIPEVVENYHLQKCGPLCRGLSDFSKEIPARSTRRGWFTWKRGTGRAPARMQRRCPSVLSSQLNGMFSPHFTERDLAGLPAKMSLLSVSVPMSVLSCVYCICMSPYMSFYYLL